MLQRVFIAFLIFVAVACDKPKPYKGDSGTEEEQQSGSGPIIVVSDMGDEFDDPQGSANPKPNSPTPDNSSSTPPAGNQCCKICKNSTPCGDACIASTKTCSKSAGCACKADGTKP